MNLITLVTEIKTSRYWIQKIYYRVERLTLQANEILNRI
jgi:hypothetical protein